MNTKQSAATEQSFRPIEASTQTNSITWYRDSQTGLGSTDPDSNNPQWMTLQDFVEQLDRTIRSKHERSN